jgi:hypothetical protein
VAKYLLEHANLYWSTLSVCPSDRRILIDPCLNEVSYNGIALFSFDIQSKLMHPARINESICILHSNIISIKSNEKR